jgi:DNA polymerase elongation subunit (family B)
MISFAAKWYGDKKVLFYSEHHNGRAEMVRAAWDLLNEADIVISYNGISFDVKHLQREFLTSGLTPPSPFKNVDLLRTVRTEFKFPSNKLDYVSKAIGIGEKLKHEGQELWNLVLAGDSKAWERMKKYNIQDVKLTESLFDHLGSWIKTMPHLSLWTQKPHACHRCNSGNLIHDGFGHTSSAVYIRLHCQDCGAWNRGINSMGKTYTRGLK